MALDSPVVKSKMVREAKTHLNVIGKMGKITLVWTKAHIGTEGNEIADDLAKEGGERGTEIELGVPKTELTENINAFVRNHWQKEWMEYEGARMSKLFYARPDRNKSKHLLKLSSYKLGRMIGLFSGHNNLNYFQNLIDGDIHPLCRLCEEETETYYHWVRECPVLREERSNIFGVATNDYYYP